MHGSFVDSLLIACLCAYDEWCAVHAGSRLRRDLMAEGGVAPVAVTASAAMDAAQNLGGMEEKFAFKRAVSRLHEMQSTTYLGSRLRA